MQTRLSTGLALHLAGRVRAARRRYRKRLARCQDEFSEAAVHALRIETRRLLALLDLVEAFHAGRSRDKLRRTFKKRLDAFDELRDTQVQLRLLQPLWREFPEAKRFGKILRRAEKRLVARLSRKIRAAKNVRLNRRLKRLEKGLFPETGVVSAAADARQAAAALRAAFDRVARLHGRIRPDDTETIHRMRVVFKRFRYMSELLRSAAPWLTPQVLKRMKAYQDLAGIIQDLEVLLARLTLAVKEQGLKSAAAAGLRTELLRQRRRAIAAFLARTDDLFEFNPPTSVVNETLHSPARRRG
jgi:CHAD domain-containing protein